MSYGLNYSVASAIARHPALFRIWHTARKKHRPLLVTRNKELVMEGYPRCANSFAVVAFELSQKRPVSLAHHLHAESQIVLGIRYDLPILVLIRDPASAAASLLLRHPEIGVAQALRRYLDFYGTVEGFCNRLILADFKDVTSNYASVIDRVNRRFSTNFNAYHNSPHNDAKVFAILDRLNVIDAKGKENMVARPTSGKKRMLHAQKKRVLSHPLCIAARSLYSRLSRLSDTTSDVAPIRPCKTKDRQ